MVEYKIVSVNLGKQQPQPIIDNYVTLGYEPISLAATSNQLMGSTQLALLFILFKKTEKREKDNGTPRSNAK